MCICVIFCHKTILINGKYTQQTHSSDFAPGFGEGEAEVEGAGRDTVSDGLTEECCFTREMTGSKSDSLSVSLMHCG